MTQPYPNRPEITLYDPLAELLGAGDGRLTYRFTDAVKLAGHACPTVAGAFLLTIRALEDLYPGQTPERGAIRVTVPGPVDAGVYGPMSQVITLITGAAADNGFQGLAGRFVRRGLMRFGDGDGDFRFERTDTGAAVTARYDPTPIPGDPELQHLVRQALDPKAPEAVVQRFRQLWRARVLAILEDAGRQTVHVVPERPPLEP
ncbi:MAG TPA: hypothetical protein ENK62_02465 [Chromatiales bacterium]|nr:hypothetical protein [Chromatiales bacterium]